VKQLLLYLPVIHSGYEGFLARHADAAEILLLGSGFTAAYPSLAKDIRALSPARAAEYLRRAGPAAPVRVVEPDDLAAAVTGDPLVLPDEAIMRDVAARYRLDAGRTVLFDRTFLRWDRDWATAKTPVSFDGEITVAELSRELLGRAEAIAGRSSDWWRQVGAVAARDGCLRARGPGGPVHRDPRRGGADRRRGPRRDQPGGRRPVHNDVSVPGLRAAHRGSRFPALLLRRPVFGARRRTDPARRGNRPDLGGY